MALEELTPSERIAGRFCLSELLGTGAGSQVWRAVDERDGAEVAIKVTRASRGKERRAERFRREFEAIAALEHPNVLDVHEEGVDGKLSWFTMEIADGGDLSIIADASPRDRYEILLQVATALDYLHTQRIVHRDLKPANVMLSRDRGVLRPKLADFGVVKVLGAPSLTHSGSVVGTVATMAPEQLEGLPVDYRADLYALGCVLYDLWTGSPPFVGRMQQVIVSHLTRPAPRLSDRADDVPPDLDELVAGLMAKSPTDRPRDALAVAAVFGRLLVAEGGGRGVAVLDDTRAFLTPPDLGAGSTLEQELALLRGEGDATAYADMPPLAEQELERVVARTLGIGRPDLPDGLVELVRDQTNGRPALVLPLLRALADATVIRRVSGGWALRRFRGELLPTVGGSAREVIADVASGLSEDARRLASAAAVLGARFERSLAEELAGVDAEPAWRELAEAGVVPDGEERFAFGQLWSVLYEDTPQELRAAWHDQAADAKATAGTATAEDTAWHRSRGRSPRAAVEPLAELAREAIAEADHRGAERYLREALRHVDERTQRARLLELLGDALLALARGEEASAVLGEALEGARGVSAGRRMRKQAQAKMIAGDTAGGIDRYEEALRTLGDPVPKGKLGAMMRIGRDLSLAWLRRLFRGGGAERPALRERALVHRELQLLFRWRDLERSAMHVAATIRLAQRLGDPELMAEGYAFESFMMSFLGRDHQAAAAEARAREIAVGEGNRASLARIEMLQAGLSVLRHYDEEASQGHANAAVEAAEASGDRFTIGFCHSNRAWAALFFGRWLAAKEDFEKARRMGEALRLDWLVADANSGDGIRAVMEGRGSEAEAFGRDLLMRCERLAMPAFKALGTEIIGSVALLDGRWEEACVQLGEARRIYMDHELERAFGFLVHFHHAEALLWRADLMKVEPEGGLLAAIEEHAQVSKKVLGRLKLFQGLADTLFGVVEARRGEHDAAEALFDRALEARGDAGHFLDGWVKARVAFERLKMGAPRAEVRKQLDAVDGMLRDAHVDGARRWLDGTRQELGV